MALTMERLKELLDGNGFNYLIDPKRDALMVGAKGVNGSYQCYILLEMDGRFLQFRLIQYANCSVSHPHLCTVLQLLADLNYQKRLIKFGWDKDDGEITAYADIWLEEDGTLTQTQFNSNMQNYFSALDDAYHRIRQTIETGKDPGEPGEPGEGGKHDEDMSEI